MKGKGRGVVWRTARGRTNSAVNNMGGGTTGWYLQARSAIVVCRLRRRSVCVNSY
jgi:hypothetical protein